MKIEVERWLLRLGFIHSRILLAVFVIVVWKIWNSWAHWKIKMVLAANRDIEWGSFAISRSKINKIAFSIISYLFNLSISSSSRSTWAVQVSMSSSSSRTSAVYSSHLAWSENKISHFITVCTYVSQYQRGEHHREGTSSWSFSPGWSRAAPFLTECGRRCNLKNHIFTDKLVIFTLPLFSDDVRILLFWDVDLVLPAPGVELDFDGPLRIVFGQHASIVWALVHAADKVAFIEIGDFVNSFAC